MLLQKKVLIVSNNDEYEQRLIERVQLHISNTDIYQCRIDLQLQVGMHSTFTAGALSFKSRQVIQQAKLVHAQAEGLHGVATACCCDDLIQIVDKNNIEIVVVPFIADDKDIQYYYTSIITILRRSVTADILCLAI